MHSNPPKPFGNRHWGLKESQWFLPAPPALIRTSCGWDYALLGMGGRGDRQPGLEKEIRNKWWCGGGQGLAKCPPWSGQCPLGWGTLENGLGGPLPVEGQDILALTLPACLLPGQRWHPGVNGGVC